MMGSAMEEFSRPVESIMRCQDFKSNFARRLSNRYIPRPVASPRQDTSLKLCPLENQPEDNRENAPERIEQCSQLSKSNRSEGERGPEPAVRGVEEARGADLEAPATRLQRAELAALNMEVETLRWQLSQTETNRQMHIALLKQVVTFLNRVKEHIECQKTEGSQESSPTRLPRSKSVLHVNKHLEYTLTPGKKISTRKISKSISNVNGFKEVTVNRSPSKLSLTSESDTGQKITEEISRLITLANTVLCTKLPELTLTASDSISDTTTIASKDDTDKEDAGDVTPPPQIQITAAPDLIEQDTTNAFILNTICNSDDAYDGITNKFIELKDKNLKNFIVSPSPLTCGLENDFADIKMNEKVIDGLPTVKSECQNERNSKVAIDKRNDYNHAISFIEDESGFSSMSSFQEIGIPIITNISPTPCKEINYIEELPDILEQTEKWKTDTIELNKQSVKVFWV